MVIDGRVRNLTYTWFKKALVTTKPSASLQWGNSFHTAAQLPWHTAQWTLSQHLCALKANQDPVSYQASYCYWISLRSLSGVAITIPGIQVNVIQKR